MVMEDRGFRLTSSPCAVLPFMTEASQVVNRLLMPATLQQGASAMQRACLAPGGAGMKPKMEGSRHASPAPQLFR